MNEPSNNGKLNKDPKSGKFLRGHKLGLGNPYASSTAKFKAILIKAVTQQDLHDVVKKLIELAKDGNVFAIKELLDRTCAKPKQETELTINQPLTDEEIEKKIDELLGK